MEGSLWKWTNYITGWQPRWFVLENGILSYYKSQEDMANGCKGSINMAVCDVVVNPTDNTRLDLDIPSEAHFYVRATTPQERQRWLVALGSCKACLQDGRSTSLITEVHHDELQTKKSELRLYCGELMQQIRDVKKAVGHNGEPDIQRLDEVSPLLTTTCEMFIQTLEDCMKLSEAREERVKLPDSPRHSNPSSPVGPVPFSAKSIRYQSVTRNSPTYAISRPRRTSSSNAEVTETVDKPTLPKPSAVIRPNQSALEDESSASSATSSSSSTATPDNTNSVLSEHSRSSRVSSNIPIGGAVQSESDSSPSSASSVEESKPKRVTFSETKTPRRLVQTFFSTMHTSFEDVRISEDGNIPVQAFLESCRSLVVLFDKLGATAFVPVKMDVSGNIRKIQVKFDTNPAAFPYLQTLVLYEKSMGQTDNSSSATVALLWLRRGLQFLKEILEEVYAGQADLGVAVTNAYSTTLKPYHGWVIKGVFALAVKAVPYMETFIEQLSPSPAEFNHSQFKTVLMSDIETYTTALDVFIQILWDFYRSQGIESEVKV